MNARTLKRLEKAAKRGAEYLDERRPSWFTKINTKKLDLSDCEVCILGQLYATGNQEDGYSRGLALLNGAVQKNPAKFGFTLSDSEASAALNFYDDNHWTKLTAIWDAEIATRRKARRSAVAA